MSNTPTNLVSLGLVSMACALLSACGGGASSGQNTENGTNTVLSALDSSANASTSSKLPEGADGISLASFWEKQVSNGFSKVGYLRGYAYQDYRNIEIKATAMGASPDGQATMVLITHPDHGAQTGDLVTLTGVSKDVADIPFVNFNRTFEITGRDANAYFITVPYATSKRDTLGFNANLYYKLKECERVQTVTQTPAQTTSPPTFFDGYEAKVAKHVVVNAVNGCSPPSRSFTTYKYYALSNPKYGATLTSPFSGQRVEGGDFASLDKSFDLPSMLVRSGQTGAIGTMTFYKTSNKTVLVGTAYLTYEILKHTANSVFISVVTTTFNDNNTLVSTMSEVYGRDPTVDTDYKLIRTTVKYNNPRRNEVVIE